jgi:hypothetical protein
MKFSGVTFLRGGRRIELIAEEKLSVLFKRYDSHENKKRPPGAVTAKGWSY